VTELHIAVDLERVERELDALARFSDAEPPAVTRVLFTETDLRARSYLKTLAAAAGLAIREDPLGNLFARWAGSEPAQPAVGTGSHIDAIPHSGRFDGTVGVLGGLEAIRALQAAGFRPRRSIELLVFTSEEPTRFGIGCIGSRALCGSLSGEELGNLRDADDHWLDHVRQSAGFHGELSAARLPPDHFSAFVELHIEQGPLLEQSGVPIGIVTAIAAPASLRISLEGAGGHAGSVLMPQRRDALCAAAEIILAVEAAARSTGSPDSVGTTGICRVHPGAINSIPNKVNLEIDVRDIRLDSRDRALADIRSAVASVIRRRQVAATIEMINSDPPAEMAAPIIDATERACRQLHVDSRRMVSRAYHDSLFMSRLCLSGMIFIPCRGGVSHRPDEFAEPEAIRRGVEVLALTLARLSEN
jgi:N-carbamoyl-L-amino-acid hydrolase